MANLFSTLAVPAGDGVGAWLDVSAMGQLKTITVLGTFDCSVTIEVSHDGTGYAPLYTFGKTGSRTFSVAAQQMRVRISGYRSGTPEVDVAANDDGARFANLPPPVGIGVGATVDVSILGSFNTFIVTGPFTGSITIEGSEDGTVWAPITTFANPGMRSMTFIAQYLRLRVQGGDAAGANIDVGAINEGGGSASSTGYCNVIDYGADPTGVANSRVEIQAALDACAAVYVPAGTYRVDGGSLVVPTGRRFFGANCQDAVLFTETASERIIDINNADQVQISDMLLRRDMVEEAYGNGIEVRGTSDDVVLRHLRVWNCMRTVRIGYEDDDDTVGDVLCIDVRCDHEDPTDESSLYGFDLEECERVRLIDCAAKHNKLDGIKLRLLTQNCEIRGGEYSHNGYGPDSEGGDGIDAFAGGDTFLIVGGDWHNNGVTAGGSGINIKTSTGTGPGAGYTRNITITGPRCYENYGAGLLINRGSAQVPPLDALPNMITVHGGVYQANGQGQVTACGIYVRGRNVSLFGPVCRDNEREGILCIDGCYDVDIHGAICIANSTSSLGTYAGISIAGERVRVYGGVYNGKNSDLLTEDADYGALPQVQGDGIEVKSVAVDILIDKPNCLNCSPSRGVSVDMTSGVCIVNRDGPNSPEGIHQGSIGSIYQRNDGGYGTALYVRESGQPNQMTKWTPLDDIEIPPEIWYQDNVSASQTAVDLTARCSGQFITFKVPRAGSIVSLTTRLTEAVTDANADSLLVKATINGAPCTLQVSHSSGTNPSGGITVQAPGVDTFSAGDLIGVELTTLGTFAPTTTDLEATLEIRPTL